MSEEKDILSALDSIDKVNPYATFLSDSTISKVSGWIDTGSYVLNAIISGSLFGGIPEGRVTLFAGESMTAKSYFILKILANAQAKGLTPVIFDTENAIDADSAERCGLDLSKVKYVPCITAEQTTNAIYKLFESIQEKGLEGKFIIAIDSLGNLQSELQMKRMSKDNTAVDMGSKARAIKSLMQVLTNYGGLTKTTVICTNHVYDDPSAMFPSLTKNMPGGKSVVFLPSVSVQLARKPVDAKREGDSKFDVKLKTSQKTFGGVIIRALTVKNRFIMQYLEAEMYLSFTAGLDRYFGLLDMAKGVGAVLQKGSVYELEDGTKLGYYKNWRKDDELWTTKILPVIESRIVAEWGYNSNEVPVELEDECE